MPASTGVYGIKNRLNGKIYVGSSSTSLARRLRCHKTALVSNRHLNDHLQSAWNKYGAKAFSFVILEHCSPDTCVFREQHWIDYYNSHNRKFGYNKSPTAGSPRGVKHSDEYRRAVSKRNLQMSEETKRKIGEASRGRIPSQEKRDKLSKSTKTMWQRQDIREAIIQANTGRKRTEETKRKISQANTGRVVSEEAKLKMRLAKLGKSRNPESVKKVAEKLRGRKRPVELMEEIRRKNTGQKRSPEVRAKMAASQKKRFQDPEQRRLSGLANLGRISPNKGKSPSEEVRRKISETLKERNRCQK